MALHAIPVSIFVLKQFIIMFFSFKYISFEPVVWPSLKNMLEIIGIWRDITDVETSLEEADSVLVSPSIQALVLS